MDEQLSPPTLIGNVKLERCVLVVRFAETPPFVVDLRAHGPQFPDECSWERWEWKLVDEGWRARRSHSEGCPCRPRCFRPLSLIGFQLGPTR